MLKNKTLGVAVGLMASLSSAAVHAQSECTGLASTLKQYNISNSSSAFLNQVHDEFCQSDGSANSKSAGLGLDVVVKAIPIKFTGSYADNKSAFMNFCKNYQSNQGGISSSNSYEEKITAGALDAVASCVAIKAANGVVITHEVASVASTNFYIARSVNTPVVIKGLFAVPSTGLTCRGIVGDKSMTFSAKSTLSVDTQNINCERSPVVRPDGSKLYEEHTITLATNVGNYTVQLPQDSRLFENSASKIAKQIQVLADQGKANDGRIAALEGRPKISVFQCPAGKSPGVNPTGGKWGFYGCTGQITTSSQCQNIEWPWSETRACTALGNMQVID